jgi:hypothetical protein
MVMPAEKTDERKYKVVYTDNELEIRFYQAATLATYYSDAVSYWDVALPAFKTLAGYIFGKNETDARISMTSPVQMEINNTASSMSFLMPEGSDPDKLPKPKDPKVILHKTIDEYVAVVKFSGFASDGDIKLYSEKLKKLLILRKILFYGNFRFQGYDPPVKIFGRRNEVLVAVKWNVK